MFASADVLEVVYGTVRDPSSTRADRDRRKRAHGPVDAVLEPACVFCFIQMNQMEAYGR